MGRQNEYFISKIKPCASPIVTYVLRNGVPGRRPFTLSSLITVCMSQAVGAYKDLCDRRKYQWQVEIGTSTVSMVCDYLSSGKLPSGKYHRILLLVSQLWVT